MSSCFLLDVVDDSIDGIYETLKRTVLISKSAGGIGLSISKRTKQLHSGTFSSYVRGINDSARYVDQGGGKRKGSFAVYFEQWHSDIISFLQFQKNKIITTLE